MRTLAAIVAIVLVLGMGSRAQAVDPIPLRVGAMLLDSSAQVYYAQDLGFFKAAGLDVQLTVLNNGSALIAATVSGSVDIGFGSASPVIQARQRGIPVHFILPAAVWIGPEGNSGMVVLKGSPIHSAVELNGKRVAVAGLQDLTQFQAQAWLDKNGGDSSTVQFVEMPYAEMAPALQQGRITAACVTEPFLGATKAVGTEIGNLSAAVGGQYMLAGWFGQDSWLQRNPEALRRFATAMQQAARWANAHQKESAAILVKYTKITPETAATMSRAHYDENDHLEVRYLQPLVDILAKYGKTQQAPAADLIWHPS